MDDLSAADIEDLIDLADPASPGYAGQGAEFTSPWRYFFWFIWMWF